MYDPSMKKQLVAVAAAVAIFGLAACGSSQDDTAVTAVADTSVVAATPTTTDEITSWETFGQVGVALYGECDIHEWGCLYGQFEALRTAAQTLPADAKHSHRAFDTWLDTYQKWEDSQCWKDTTDDNFASCSMYEIQLKTGSDGLLEGMERFATEG